MLQLRNLDDFVKEALRQRANGVFVVPAGILGP
jgi:hypothetical protein